MGPHTVHGLRRYLTALGLVLTAISPAFAQGEATIRGQVLAAANNSALAGVTVKQVMIRLTGAASSPSRSPTLSHAAAKPRGA